MMLNLSLTNSMCEGTFCGANHDDHPSQHEISGSASGSARDQIEERRRKPTEIDPTDPWKCEPVRKGHSTDRMDSQSGNFQGTRAQRNKTQRGSEISK